MKRKRGDGFPQKGFNFDDVLEDKPDAAEPPAPPPEPPVAPASPEFDGDDYQPATDKKRLTTQLDEIFAVLKSGAWYTLFELARLTGHPEASISAQLRNLRKPRFGGHKIEKRRQHAGGGLYEYRLVFAQPVHSDSQPSFELPSRPEDLNERDCDELGI
jgi:hypothetical protein